MHELGIVSAVIKHLEKVSAENNLSEIASVTLEIGEVSAVIPEYLSDCWAYFRKREQLIEKAELIIERLPAVTLCDDCRKTYQTVRYGKQCPYCGSADTHLLRGNEFCIKQIEAR